MLHEATQGAAQLAGVDLARALDPTLLMRGAGLAPDPWQADVLQSNHRRRMLLCSRQSGKSTTAACAALHAAMFTPGSLVLLVSPAQRQSSELLRKCVDIKTALGGVSDDDLESALRISFRNESRIISLPGREQTIRGYSKPDLIVLDEAAHMQDSLISAVLPMLAASPNGRLLALSTPCGRRGWFHETWSSNTGWQKTKITWRECPRITEDNVMFFKRTMGPTLFEQEFECSFLDESSAVFPLALIENCFADFDGWRI